MTPSFAVCLTVGLDANESPSARRLLLRSRPAKDAEEQRSTPRSRTVCRRPFAEPANDDLRDPFMSKRGARRLARECTSRIHRRPDQLTHTERLSGEPSGLGRAGGAVSNRNWQRSGLQWRRPPAAYSPGLRLGRPLIPTAIPWRRKERSGADVFRLSCRSVTHCPSN